MSIADNLAFIRSGLPENVTLVAVSKTMPADKILEAYNAGQRIFGENRVQELLAKKPLLPEDIEWHFIGHLQTNKVRYVVPAASLIHSADSLKLISAINAEAKKTGIISEILIQVRIAREETKFGMDPADVPSVAADYVKGAFGNITLRGLMGMATLTGDNDQVRKEFTFLSEIFNDLKKDIFAGDPRFNILSMGMSDDHHIAVEAGSTMVRIGSSVFGHREYN